MTITEIAAELGRKMAHENYAGPNPFGEANATPALVQAWRRAFDAEREPVRRMGHNFTLLTTQDWALYADTEPGCRICHTAREVLFLNPDGSVEETLADDPEHSVIWEANK